jgi:hypothetical protein
MPKPFHVLDLIRAVEETVPGFLDTYEALSEIAHPNGQGVFGLFGTIDKVRYVASFGPNAQKTYPSRGLIAEALLSALIVFEPVYNRIADLLPAFLKQLPEIWPQDRED